MSTITSPQTQTRRLRVAGMTCGSCASKVAAQLEALPEVARAEVDKASDTATVELAVPTSTSYLQGALDAKYRLTEGAASQSKSTAEARGAGSEDPLVQNDADSARAPAEAGFFATYRPLLTIVGLVLLVTLLAQYPYAGGFDGILWMRHFMAGFFIAFSFFKLLNISGFAESYAMYDEVAKRVPAWGYVYPFVELALGLAYLTDVAPVGTNIATIVVLGVSAVGVIRSVLDRRAIKCACLGDVFNLPMSTVTIVEDVTMVGMAAWMLMRMG